MSAPPPRPVLGTPSLGRRVLHMTALWSYFGVVMGAGMGLTEGSWLDVAAHVVAGLLVLPLLGSVLGLIGGPWRDAFVGAVTGCLIGLAVGLSVAAENPVQLGYVCLLIGGLIGATFPENCRRLQRLAALLVRSGRIHAARPPQADGLSSNM